MRYYFAIDTGTGRAFKGCAVRPAEEASEDCTIEGDEQVWLNQERAFYVNGSWHIYARLSVTAPSTAGINQTITATATLPPGSPDSEVEFRVAWQDGRGEWHRTDPIKAPVIDAQASKDFQFTTTGLYRIEALSEHHGAAFAEVTVT